MVSSASSSTSSAAKNWKRRVEMNLSGGLLPDDDVDDLLAAEVARFAEEGLGTVVVVVVTVLEVP